MTMFRPHQRIRHVATGRLYRVVDTPPRLKLESDGAAAYSYTAVSGDDITLWVRPQVEMEDGRFEACA